MEHDDYEGWVRKLIADERPPPLALVRFPEDPRGAFTVTWFYRSLRRIDGLDGGDRLVSLWTAFGSIIAERYLGKGDPQATGKGEGEMGCGRGAADDGFPIKPELFYDDPYWTERLNEVVNGDYQKYVAALKALCPVRDEASGEEATITTGGVKEVLEVVRTVRKNLFRGTTGPDDISPRDSALIRSSFALLLLLVTQHLLKTGTISSVRAFSIDELMDGTDLLTTGDDEEPRDRSVLQL